MTNLTLAVSKFFVITTKIRHMGPYECGAATIRRKKHKYTKSTDLVCSQKGSQIYFKIPVMQARKFLTKYPTKYFWQLPKILASLITISMISGNVFAADTAFQSDKNGGAKSRIIASFYQDDTKANAAKTNASLIIGFEVEVAKGWKIYAPDNSGFGVPPSFDFANSHNINIEKFNPIFPKPQLAKEQIGAETIEYSVYKDRVIIPIELEVLDATKGVALEVQVNYGLCKDICIPVDQKFFLNIPAGQSDAEALKNIQQYLDTKQINSPINAEPQTDNLVVDGTQPESPANNSSSNNFPKISLLRAIIIAFIGGAILNIMPCVLPVLSIKLLSIINHSGAKSGRIRFAFFSTTLGIVFSFAIFAAAAVFLKSIGNAVGWGFQFQNPYFLLFLLAVLMVFIANLLGLFEFNLGGSLGSVLNKKITTEEQKKNIFIPNFLSGILAVLLATPCSAPFVGVAISFALGSDVKEIFSIFLAMSLGLALPYLFLIVFPKIIKLLPKSGAWMVRAKHLMAGFLAATAMWMVYILCDNIGFIAAMSAAILAILILLFFKIVSKTNLSGPNCFAKISATLIIFIAIIAAIFVVPNRLAYLDKMMEKEQQANWIKFDPAKIPELVAQGKTVIVDITADWCVSCKANKLLVLSSKEIKAKLRESNIVAMRGDLTKPDKEIFDFMQKHNRYGIPFDIVFGPSAPDGVLTSELLSKDALLKAIKSAQ